MVRAAVVFYPNGSRDKLLAVAKALAKGIESQGHQVDVIDGSRDLHTKLTAYQYIAVGSEPASFISSKIAPELGRFLAQAGMVGGKRSFGFMLKKGLAGNRALRNLMKVMEAEGMFLRFSEVLGSPEDAEEVGKRLLVEQTG